MILIDIENYELNCEIQNEYTNLFYNFKPPIWTFFGIKYIIGHSWKKLPQTMH